MNELQHHDGVGPGTVLVHQGRGERPVLSPLLHLLLDLFVAAGRHFVESLDVDPQCLVLPDLEPV